MIILLAGWFRTAAIGAGFRGWGQGSAVRPTAQRRGLDAVPGRRILSVAGTPVRGGERAVFLGPAVPDRMDPDDLAVAGDLDRFGDDRDLNLPASPAVAGAVGAAGERHRPRRVHDPGYRHSVGRRSGSEPTGSLSQLGLLLDTGLVSVEFAPLDMFGDQHVTVEDPDQVLGGDRLDRFPANTIGTRYLNPAREIAPC